MAPNDPNDDGGDPNPYEFNLFNDLREAFGSHDSEEDDDSGYEIRIPRWVIITLVALGIAFVFAVFYGLRFLVLSVLEIDWSAAAGFVSHWPGRLMGSVAIAGIGLAFYWLRCWRRAWYGLIEIGVAFVAGWVALGAFGDAHRLQEDGGIIASWIGVFAACYVVVRGLDNFNEGLKVKKEDGDEIDKP